MREFIAAIDQGTTSTRFMVFDHGGTEISKSQLEHRQIRPRPGWVEHDPLEILDCARTVAAGAMQKRKLKFDQLSGIGVTNQRETTVIWNPKTGQPWYNAIVWQDTRTHGIVAALEHDGKGQVIRRKTGLLPATYFSGPKIQWMLDNIDGVRRAAEVGEAVFGNIDTWLIWNLTGGPDGGAHVTDVTNASRTMLMDLRALDWDGELLDLFGIPATMLPSIRPSSNRKYYDVTRAPDLIGERIPLCGDLGDQQAAMLGQACFAPGTAKNTYGTGSFMMFNTGGKIVPSKNGLLTTLCFKMNDNQPVYALEGSIAVTGSAVQWLRDQLGIIRSTGEIEALANSVEDSGDVFFVPAFSGLFAPYWRSDARGAIVGLSGHSTRAHLARATLEAICYQTKDVLDAMTADSGVRLDVLKVDGGATVNETLMQMQADILGVEVIRPVIMETTALGAAYAAGLATGFWKGLPDLEKNWKADRSWTPRWSSDRRESGFARWKKAVERTLNWIETS